MGKLDDMAKELYESNLVFADDFVNREALQTCSLRV